MSQGETFFAVDSPPHWRSATGLARINGAMLAALAPVALVGAMASGFGPGAVSAIGPGHGLMPDLLRTLVRELGLPPGVLNVAGALGLVLFGAAAGLLGEIALALARGQPRRPIHGRGALAGVLLALMMPATAPGWVLALGVAVAALIGEISRGRLRIPLHPALIGWLVLLLLCQHHIYPVGSKSIAAMHPAAIYLTALAGTALIALGHLRWQAPLGVILGVTLCTPLCHLLAPDRMTEFNPILQLAAGHVMLTAFFIAPDYSSSPVRPLPALLYGAGLGALIVALRTFGPWPDAAPMAALWMNPFSPALDLIRPRVKGAPHE